MIALLRVDCSAISTARAEFDANEVSAESLHVPPHVPVGQFWSVTVYDYDTMAFIRDVPRVALTSYDKDLHTNGDGSVDVTFGPAASNGDTSNWLPTKAGHRYIVLFRFYKRQRQSRIRPGNCRTSKVCIE